MVETYDKISFFFIIENSNQMLVFGVNVRPLSPTLFLQLSLESMNLLRHSHDTHTQKFSERWRVGRRSVKR